PDEMLSEKVVSEPVQITIPGAPGLLYIEPSKKFHPPWTSLFLEFLSLKSVPKVSALSALFLVKTAGRYFALTFGNGRFLLKPEAWEERFGLMVALNLADDDGFRVVDKQSLDSIQSHTRTQSGQATTPDRFGVDVEQDMLRAIVSTPKSQADGTRMTGSDSLSVSVPMDLSDLPTLLKSYKIAFETDLNDSKYDWVNNIAMLRGGHSITSDLEALLVDRINEAEPPGMWLSIPEIIDWTKVAGFTYTHGKRIVHPDINLSGFLGTVAGQAITLDLLNKRRVSCVDEDLRKLPTAWSIYKCLYAEIDYQGATYVLNGGAWFKVASNFVDKTNADFAAIPLSSLSLPLYVGGGEGAYNQSVASAYPEKF
ncbi:MAG: TIGR04141 family sporadically distributed protein, partial [Phycisphaerales bacterium]|nr:TIGR04141 family sporadically distributed protein [Phycisphaerales bacterium]